MYVYPHEYQLIGHGYLRIPVVERPIFCRRRWVREREAPATRGTSTIGDRGKEACCFRRSTFFYQPLYSALEDRLLDGGRTTAVANTNHCIVWFSQSYSLTFLLIGYLVYWTWLFVGLHFLVSKYYFGTQSTGYWVRYTASSLSVK